MTPEAQRIAIAGLLPNLIHVETRNVLNPDQPMETTFLWKDTELIRDWYPVKERDWLWIMHEAEKGLTDEQHTLFRKLLFTGFYNRGEGTTNDAAERVRVSATAPQRAEAFLRTLGLWKSS